MLWPLPFQSALTYDVEKDLTETHIVCDLDILGKHHGVEHEKGEEGEAVKQHLVVGRVEKGVRFPEVDPDACLPLPPGLHDKINARLAHEADVVGLERDLQQRLVRRARGLLIAYFYVYTCSCMFLYMYVPISTCVHVRVHLYIFEYAPECVELIKKHKYIPPPPTYTYICMNIKIHRNADRHAPP